MNVKSVFQNRINTLAILCFIAITLITLFKSAVELEDAEQAYYSQWLRWGYDDQPPLYTWIQYLVNSIFGISKISFSIVRGAIFSGILWVLYSFAKNVLKDKTASELAIFSLVLLPVFIDFTFRRLSHTSLLCLSIVASYWIIQRLITKKTFLNYLFFGIIIGVGILTKYNYVLVLGALALVTFFDTDIKNVLFNTYSIVTAVVAMLIVFPHFTWLLGSDGFLEELKASVQLKTDNENQNAIPFISAIISLLLNLMKLAAPLFIILLAGFAFKKVQFKKVKRDWCYRLMLAQLTILLLFFVSLNIQKVEERWLLPLLLPFTVLLFRSLTFKLTQKWARTGFALFFLVIGIQTVRTPVEKILDIPSSVHFSFKPISAKLNKNYKDKQWILPDVTYGGNIRLQNPKVEIFSKDDFSLPKSKLYQINAIEVVLEKENLKNRVPLDSIIGFGKEKENVYFVTY